MANLKSHSICEVIFEVREGVYVLREPPRHFGKPEDPKPFLLWVERHPDTRQVWVFFEEWGGFSWDLTWIAAKDWKNYVMDRNVMLLKPEGEDLVRLHDMVQSYLEEEGFA